MNKISVLDCTLRDGGYVNNWNFGENNIKDIIEYLSKSNIEIVECGFLTNEKYNSNVALFNSTKQIKGILPKTTTKTMFVAMITTNKNDFDFKTIENCDNSSITGIRIAFHKYEDDKAIRYAKTLIDKGYEVFIQPMGTTAYTEIELLDLVVKINELNPYAFYIVDTFGSMHKRQLLNMFNIIDNNLSRPIRIGFHSHNNLQLSFSNSIELIEFETSREVIIDSSVLGMGRGSGNLNTELIMRYLNDIDIKKYDLNYIYEIIDNYIINIKKNFDWGYSVPYYISAVNQSHPNYAKFLMEKEKNTNNKINEILSSIKFNKKIEYDEKYINDLFIEYHNL